MGGEKSQREEGGEREREREREREGGEKEGENQRGANNYHYQLVYLS